MDEALNNKTPLRDIRSLMAEIREKVKKDVAVNSGSKIEYSPKTGDFNAGQHKAGELVYSEDLRFLNLNFVIPQEPNLDHIISHRGGIIGKIIVTFKRKLFKLVWALFRDYFAKEQEYRSHLVKYLNLSSRYIDARDADNFWQLIRKIDYDVTKTLERVERASDDAFGTIRSVEKSFSAQLVQGLTELQKQVTGLKAGIEGQSSQIATMDSVTRGLEGIISRATAKSESSAWEASAAGEDLSYLLLENRFRGSEAEIERRMQIYPPYFKAATKPVIEIGSGRGELLGLFAKENIPALGVDLDAAMVEVCKSKNLKVVLKDALSYLQECEDNSLGGIIAVQVVEHLRKKDLEDLIILANKKLAAGGRVIFETINPQSLLALSSNYFRDPTHVAPQHPDSLKYLLELKGFRVEEVRYLSPVEGVLKEIKPDEQMPYRWHSAIDLINHNIRQLNQLLYGYMDFAIVAIK